ncbi:MAG: glycine cleavage system protein GcvH [Deltaproteobacteria bacterium]|nr:glycine cleavage system protein GcvH [Deltaproteobacteria bacterium]
MQFPKDLKYTPQHEWIRVEGDLGTCGISDFAQDSLGDVVHVELPAVGAVLRARDRAAEVESVKAVSDVYAPVSGTVTEVNEGLDGSEDAVNRDPYGEGWLFRLRLFAPEELATLLDVAAYEAHVAEAGH